MDTIPRLDESDIRRYCGEQSFERGRRYYANGSIYDTRREGNV